MKNQTNNKRTFSFFSSPITNTKPSRDFTLLYAYNYIVGHQASHSTNRLRSIIDKDYAKQFKARNFDYCTFSGTFQYRNDKALIRHSGLLCLDFDHLNNIEEATHKEWFNAISNYLMHTHSLQTDKSGKDISRACFLPHDPFCYITPKLLRNEQERI